MCLMRARCWARRKLHPRRGLGCRQCPTNPSHIPTSCSVHTAPLAHNNFVHPRLPASLKQDVAKAYCVACTPEFFVFDADLRLTYHGQVWWLGG